MGRNPPLDLALPRPDAAAAASRPALDRAALAAAWWRAVEPLWVAGLAVLCLLVGWAAFTSPWLGLQGKTYDWAQYAVAGVVFPGLLFGAPLLWTWRGWPEGVAVPCRRLLAVGGVAAVAAVAAATVAKYGATYERWPVVLAGVQTAVMTRPWRRERFDPRRAAVAFVVAFAAWTVVVSLNLHPLLAPPAFLAGFALAFALVCGATRDPGAGERVAPVRLWTPANAVALALIALMSLRTEQLFQLDPGRLALHHWGAWVGPADLVRGGGWLLWDVPSTYGFLSVLTIAALPTATTWQGLYLLQALANVVVAGGLFLLLRALRSGWPTWLFALAFAIAAPMFLMTFDPAAPVTAAFILPNFGPYRFLWCFVLVAVLVWEYATDEDSPRHGWVLVAGTLAWLVGVLWSTESAFFCSATWLPAYAAIVLRRAATDPVPRRWPRMAARVAARAAAWLALPVALLAASGGLIALVYAVGLGHLPDWLATLDYVRGVGLNLMVAVNEPVGPVLSLLLGFCALAVGAWYAGTRDGRPTRSFGLWLGLLGAFWATASYNYQRGGGVWHPVGYAALGVLVVLAVRLPGATGWGAIARAAAVPLLVFPLVSPLAAVVADPLAGRAAAAGMAATVRQGFAIDAGLPDADAELQALLAEADVGPDDPIAYAGDPQGNALLPWRPGGAAAGERVVAAPFWLPAHPSQALKWVPPGRGAEYVSRFIQRAPRSGWLILNTTGRRSSADEVAYVPGLEPWLFDLLRQTHVPTRVYESANWQLVWFEYVGADPAVARPDPFADRLGPLPPDVSVDGTPLSETAHPTMWTVFGEGWGRLDEGRGRGWRGATARLWVYSPDDRAVRLGLTRARGGGDAWLRVGKADDKADDTVAARWAAGQAVDAPLVLRAGWNPVDLTVAPRGAANAVGDPEGVDATTGSGQPAAPDAAEADVEGKAGGRAPRIVVERVEIANQPER